MEPINATRIVEGYDMGLEPSGRELLAWLADVFPFLPKDFDARYRQAAPEDQQLVHSKGRLRWCWAASRRWPCRFTLPQTFPSAIRRDAASRLLTHVAPRQRNTF